MISTIADSKEKPPLSIALCEGIDRLDQAAIALQNSCGISNFKAAAQNPVVFVSHLVNRQINASHVFPFYIRTSFSSPAALALLDNV